MTIYNIEIDYTTGGSFSTERATEMLDVVTESLGNAKENLKRIKKHYVQHEDSPDFNRDYELELLTDKGNIKITPFWIGYFETLHGAKIVIDEDPEMAFEI